MAENASKRADSFPSVSMKKTLINSWGRSSQTSVRRAEMHSSVTVMTWIKKKKKGNKSIC